MTGVRASGSCYFAFLEANYLFATKEIFTNNVSSEYNYL